ncbi:peptidoglycan endopeptidase [Sphingomonas sp. GB1N7]|uniref:peptidoglycan endopeptidase n=1 Tax=Parasphingomonas caseinilytica TaxID=3096158 RepID=UPI002FC68896
MSGREKSVAAAQGAVGAKFRLHGRDPAFGLDCVGLAGLAMRAAGCDGDLPGGYALRGGVAADFVALIHRDMLVRVDVPVPGDLMLFAVGPAQFHLAIKSVGGFVHADAMLRRVVERPDPAPWPLVAAWGVIEG